MNRSHPHKHQNLTGEHAFTDIGQLILFLVFILAVMLDIFLYKFSNKITGTASQIIIIPLFLIFFLIGSCFIFTSHKVIFQDTGKEVGLVTDGAFKIVRHPMYFGSMLVFFSFVILSNSVLALLVWFVICIFYYFVSRYEEKLLVSKFGYEYREYQKNVPMFIPFFMSKNIK